MTLMTRKEAAARLGMSLPTLDQERSTGRLAYIQRKPGSKVWITEEAIAELGVMVAGLMESMEAKEA